LSELAYILIATQALAVAIVGGLFALMQKKLKIDNSKQEKRAIVRAEEAQLAMRLMSATMSLAVANAIAIQKGEVNGRMDKAIEDADSAQKAYFEFVNRVASERVAKN